MALFPFYFLRVHYFSFFSCFPTKYKDLTGEGQMWRSLWLFFADSRIWWRKGGMDMGGMIAACFILSQLGFTSKKIRNIMPKATWGWKMVDVCHIPQPDFFFNTFLASCQGCISRQCWCVLSHSLPFISTHKLHLQGVKRLIVSLLLISDKGFCHITAPCIFSTV